MSYTWNFYGIVNQLYLNLKTKKKKKKKEAWLHHSWSYLQKDCCLLLQEGATPHHSDIG